MGVEVVFDTESVCFKMAFSDWNAHKFDWNKFQLNHNLMATVSELQNVSSNMFVDMQLNNSKERFFYENVIGFAFSNT